MKRILVIGCCGAGKSTFARKLHAFTKIDLIHLDQYFWKPNWVETKRDEWTETVNNLASKSSWIIDGTFTRTIDPRIARADTIVYFDYPTWSCFWRVIKRVAMNYGKVRPDMPTGCEERFDWGFLRYVANFNSDQRKGLLEKMDVVRHEKTIVFVRNDRQAQTYLDGIQDEDFQH